MRKISVGAAIIVIMALVALTAQWLAPNDPQAMVLAERLHGPSSKHWLGQDENGSDVLSKVIYGSRVSLGVAWSVVLVSAVLGLAIGSYAGYKGKTTDHVVMRVVDIFVAFPGFLIALAFVAMLGPSLGNMIFALCFTSWTSFARLVRGEVLHLKEREHVQAARAMGAGGLRITVLHIWPNLLGLLIVQATFAMAATIIAESGLSFLGLGVPPTIPTWGSLLSSGRRVLSEAPHVSFAPGIAIMTLVLGFNLLGDGLRDVLDPRRALNKN
jgi:peptide/nickel transport system permease protein